MRQALVFRTPGSQNTLFGPLRTPGSALGAGACMIILRQKLFILLSVRVSLFRYLSIVCCSIHGSCDMIRTYTSTHVHVYLCVDKSQSSILTQDVQQEPHLAR